MEKIPTTRASSFVMIEPDEPSPAPTRLRLNMNWAEELERLVPTNN
jgi:hypothetical protein